MLIGHQRLHVISLKSQSLFILFVANDKKFVLLLLHLSLKQHVVSGGRHKSNSQVDWDDDVHYVDLLDGYAVGFELFLEKSGHGSCELGLDVSDSSYFDLFEEVTDLFVALFLQELFKTVGPEIVEELADVLFLSLWCQADVEIDADVHRDSHVVFGRHIRNRALESDSIFSNHNCNSLVIAVTAFEPWGH